MEIAAYMNDALDSSWSERRGMIIEVVAIAKVTPDDESRRRIEKIDDAIMMAISVWQPDVWRKHRHLPWKKRHPMKPGQ